MYYCWAIEAVVYCKRRLPAMFTEASHLPLHPSSGSTAQIVPWPHLLRFLNHTELDTRQDSSGRVISLSQRPLPTQDDTTYKHKTQTSMPRAGF
jgi:hypothetical protein